MTSTGAFAPTVGQLGIWVQDRLGAGAGYNVAFAYRLGRTVDLAALHRALQAVIARHEAFRTVFREIGGEVNAEVLDSPPEFDLVTGRFTASEAAELLAVSWNRPFDLAVDRPLRGCLIDVEDDHYVLSLTVHHIVFDDWSMGVLLDEIAAAYRGGYVATADDAAMAADRELIVRSRSLPRRSESRARALASACARLRDVPERLDLPRRPTDGTAGQPFRGATREAVADPDVALAVRELSGRAGCTEYVVYLAAWATLISIYAQHDDIAVGTPFADRSRPGCEGLVGYFLDSLVVRGRIAGSMGFLQVVETFRDELYRSMDDATQVAYEDIVRELAPDRDDPTAPLFTAWFAWDDGHARLVLDGVDVERVQIPTTAAKFELAMFVSREDPAPRLVLEYAASRFEDSVAEGMLRHYRQLLAVIMTDPQIAVRDIDVLDGGDHDTLRRWGRRPGRTGDSQPAHLAEQFRAIVAASPGAAAVEDGSRTVTYAELNVLVVRVATLLRSAGVGAGDVVGISAARSPEMIAAVLAVLDLGAGYLALDASHPQERLRYMIEDGGVQVVLVDAGSATAFRGLPVRVSDLGDLPAREAARQLPSAHQSAESLAYITYTSGSTGRPKGIRMSHRAVWNLLGWQQHAYPVVGAGSRTLQFASLSFDVSAQEIFGALCTGGTLVLISEHDRNAVHDIMRIVRDRRVERLFMPAPALLEAVESAVARGVVPDRLRVLISGSEQLVVTTALRDFLRVMPQARLYNEYGPSESHVATVYAAAAAPSSWPTWLPIGVAIGDTEIRLLDARGMRTPPGSVGEIYLAGPGLADGYSRQPRTTAAAFVPDPYAQRPGARMYRTGDLARFLPSGDLEYLGRRDSQIKIRGFRVELEEVRAAVDAAPFVAQSFVAVAGSPGNHAIHAYWRRRAGQPGTARLIREHLRGLLPDYMLPARLTEVSDFPLTPNGKVDQRALARMPVRPADDEREGGPVTTAASTGNPVAVAIAATMARLLGRDAVSEHDDFFDIGGHSLLANRLVWTLETEGVAMVTLRNVVAGRCAARIAVDARPVPETPPAPAQPVVDVEQRLAALIDSIGGH